MIEHIRPLWLRRMVMIAAAPLILIVFVLWHGAENLGELGPAYRELWQGDRR